MPTREAWVSSQYKNTPQELHDKELTELRTDLRKALGAAERVFATAFAKVVGRKPTEQDTRDIKLGALVDELVVTNTSSDVLENIQALHEKIRTCRVRLAYMQGAGRTSEHIAGARQALDSLSTQSSVVGGVKQETPHTPPASQTLEATTNISQKVSKTPEENLSDHADVSASDVEVLQKYFEGAYKKISGVSFDMKAIEQTVGTSIFIQACEDVKNGTHARSAAFAAVDQEYLRLRQGYLVGKILGAEPHAYDEATEQTRLSKMWQDILKTAATDTSRSHESGIGADPITPEQVLFIETIFLGNKKDTQYPDTNMTYGQVYEKFTKRFARQTGRLDRGIGEDALVFDIVQKEVIAAAASSQEKQQQKSVFAKMVDRLSNNPDKRARDIAEKLDSSWSFERVIEFLISSGILLTGWEIVEEPAKEWLTEKWVEYKIQVPDKEKRNRLYVWFANMFGLEEESQEDEKDKIIAELKKSKAIKDEEILNLTAALAGKAPAPSSGTVDTNLTPPPHKGVDNPQPNPIFAVGDSIVGSSREEREANAVKTLLQEGFIAAHRGGANITNIEQTKAFFDKMESRTFGVKKVTWRKFLSGLVVGVAVGGVIAFAGATGGLALLAPYLGVTGSIIASKVVVGGTVGYATKRWGVNTWNDRWAHKETGVRNFKDISYIIEQTSKAQKKYRNFEDTRTNAAKSGTSLYDMKTEHLRGIYQNRTRWDKIKSALPGLFGGAVAGGVGYGMYNGSLLHAPSKGWSFLSSLYENQTVDGKVPIPVAVDQVINQVDPALKVDMQGMQHDLGAVASAEQAQTAQFASLTNEVHNLRTNFEAQVADLKAQLTAAQQTHVSGPDGVPSNAGGHESIVSTDITLQGPDIPQPFHGFTQSMHVRNPSDGFEVLMKGLGADAKTLGFGSGQKSPFTALFRHAIGDDIDTAAKFFGVPKEDVLAYMKRCGVYKPFEVMSHNIPKNWHLDYGVLTKSHDGVTPLQHIERMIDKQTSYSVEARGAMHTALGALKKAVQSGINLKVTT